MPFQPTPKGVATARERGGEEGRQAPSDGKSGAKAWGCSGSPGEEPRGEPGRALPPQPLTSPASRRSAPWTPETLTPNILEHFALGPQERDGHRRDAGPGKASKPDTPTPEARGRKGRVAKPDARRGTPQRL